VFTKNLGSFSFPITDPFRCRVVSILKIKWLKIGKWFNQPHNDRIGTNNSYVEKSTMTFIVEISMCKLPPMNESTFND